MILTTTPTLEGHPIREYRGVVTGEAIIGANAVKDFMAGMPTSLEVGASLMRVCCAKRKTQQCAKWPSGRSRWAATPWWA